MELALAGEGENAVRRFDIDGPEDAEMLIKAFEDSTTSGFDAVSGEIVFGYDYIDIDLDDEDDQDDDEDDEDEADDEDEDETSAESDEEKKRLA
jgi:hypothetical protein